MSFETVNRSTTTTTHRHRHTHNTHRSTLVEEHLVHRPIVVASCYADTGTSATRVEKSAFTAAAAASCDYIESGRHEIEYYCERIGRPSDPHDDDPSDGPYDFSDFKLDALDFSLTKRLLGAVFFLLVIYAWKQYIDDEEESDTIYI